jgi:hypothetical protein
MDEGLRARIQDKRLAGLYDHWQAMVEGGMLPARTALDPLSLPRGNLIILDVERGAALRFRYRLFGSNLVDGPGLDRTGRYADEPGAVQAPTLVLPLLTRVAATARPEVVEGPLARDPKLNYIRFETLILPLADDGCTVSHLLIGVLRSRTEAVARSA